MLWTTAIANEYHHAFTSLHLARKIMTPIADTTCSHPRNYRLRSSDENRSLDLDILPFYLQRVQISLLSAIISVLKGLKTAQSCTFANFLHSSDIRYVDLVSTSYWSRILTPDLQWWAGGVTNFKLCTLNRSPQRLGGLGKRSSSPRGSRQFLMHLVTGTSSRFSDRTGHFSPA